MSLTAARHRHTQQGFTLIEVMICLFMLAIGLLGMTSLQNEALKHNHAAFIDSQAQYLLADMAERIRANRGNDTYVIAYTENPPTQSLDCLTGTSTSLQCTSNQMAIWDLNQWRSKVTNSDYLPQGQSQIQYDPTTRVFTISIRYDWSAIGGTDIDGGKRTLSITTRI